VKILFCVTHLGLLRHYAPVLRQLADRGHSVHLSCNEYDRGLGDSLDFERMTSGLTDITFGLAPARETSRWATFSSWLQLLMDYVRYLDPRFANATALRARVERQVAAWSLTLVRLLQKIDPSSVAILRWLKTIDRAVPPSGAVYRFLAEARPDLVLVSPYVYIGFGQGDYVKAARRLGIPSAACIASWDNLTNKGVISTVPDRLFVWNEAQREEATSLHGVPHDQVILTGAQLFDRWFGRTPSRSREAFCAAVGLDPAKPFILYTGSSDFIAPKEGDFVRRWLRLVRAAADPALASAGILIRPHPKNYAQFRVLDLEGIGNAVVFPKVARTFEQSFDTDFFDSLYYSSLVVGINTSAQIEAAIVGRAVCTWRAPDFVHSQDGTLHFEHLANEQSGLLRVAESAEEHLSHLSEGLAHPEEMAARTRRFVASFVRPGGLETPATTVFADSVEQLQTLAVRPQRAPAWGVAVRFALYPFAIVLPWLPTARDPDRPVWAVLVRFAVDVMVHTASVYYAARRLMMALGFSLRTIAKYGRKVRREVVRAPELTVRTVFKYNRKFNRESRKWPKETWRRMLRRIERWKTGGKKKSKKRPAMRPLARPTQALRRTSKVLARHGRRALSVVRRTPRQGVSAVRKRARRAIQAGRRAASGLLRRQASVVVPAHATEHPERSIAIPADVAADMGTDIAADLAAAAIRRDDETKPPIVRA
jgi:hypothetical protein